MHFTNEPTWLWFAALPVLDWPLTVSPSPHPASGAEGLKRPLPQPRIVGIDASSGPRGQSKARPPKTICSYRTSAQQRWPRKGCCKTKFQILRFKKMELATMPVRFSNIGVPLCYQIKAPFETEISIKNCNAKIPFVIVCVTAVDFVRRRFLGSCWSLSCWTSGSGGSSGGRAGSSLAFHWNIEYKTQNNGIFQHETSLNKLRCISNHLNEKWFWVFVSLERHVKTSVES